ncbi:MoxR-like ATPase [Paenibacillus sp. UNCCL117]|uniref:AAA family ATPase n=1 Tax=unclassified Paenibacillus TaxID=185978 RepID=UPI0008852675|nr:MULTISPECIES: MoxR family ATPase [unclassified Paenibacillus]SDD90152.1 MoxR-like ATPase [Paenibacillus sp. cl123]SFW43987.1 MoxR-like ATPase [Paenibacillus sp. UNCCL117]
MASSSSLTDPPQVILEKIVYQAEKAIVGKRDVIEKLLVALLAGGHVLLEDVPGVGKTMLVRAIARTLECDFKRIQCTPDLLPSDLTGISIYNQRTGEFEFRPGPLLAPIVLADELNRTSPRTQAALLEAMEEKRVTVDGHTYPLPEPFFLLATQNPIDFEGTYPLPEAQLDRFLLKLRIGYPEPQDEVEMLSRMEESSPLTQIRAVLLREEFTRLQQEARTVHVDDTIRQYVVQLVTATRQHPELSLGASPRASLALMRAAQAEAYRCGRRYVIPDDIKGLCLPVLAHRLIPSSSACLNGREAEAVLASILAATPVPVRRHAAV